MAAQNRDFSRDGNELRRSKSLFSMVGPGTFFMVPNISKLYFKQIKRSLYPYFYRLLVYGEDMPVLKTSEEDKRGFRLPMVIPTSELQVSRYIFF